MKSLYLIFLCSLFGLLHMGCSQTADQSGSSASPEHSGEIKGQSQVQDDESANNILQVAVGSKDHTTLVAGVQAADLEDVLVNAGPLTVFAPNNAAFDALPEGTLDELLKPENKSTLARIIKYHASPGSYKVESLRDGMQLYQATGHYLKIAKEGNETLISGARILGSVEASNGIVHVIDKVLLPPD